MTAPVLDMMAWQLGDSGIMLNPDSLTTPFFDVEQVTGIDMPDFKQDESDRAGDHGSYMSALWLEPRTIGLEGTIWGNSPSEIDVFLQALKENWKPSEDDQWLYFKRPGIGTRRFSGKSLGLKYDLTNAYSRGEVPIQAQFFCGYPLEYASDFEAMVGTKASATTPLDVVVTNDGNMNVPGIIKIERIISAPVISNLTTGQSIQINKNLTLASQSITLDLLNKLAYDQAGATVRQYFAAGSKWITFAPGANTIRLTGSGGVAGSFAKMTVEAWDAWW